MNIRATTTADDEECENNGPDWRGGGSCSPQFVGRRQRRRWRGIKLSGINGLKSGKTTAGGGRGGGGGGEEEGSVFWDRLQGPVGKKEEAGSGRGEETPTQQRRRRRRRGRETPDR